MKTKQKREHNWTKEDAIITLYCAEHGTNGLLVTNEKELAESVIGTSLNSLTQMKLNFDWMKGVGNRDHVSIYQKKVFDQHHNTPKEELKDIVNNIISNRDLEQNKEEYIVAKKIRDAKAMTKANAEKKQKDDDNMWRRLGKDPKKMKKVV